MDNIKEIEQAVNNLMKIMKRLRGPEGCPWDKKQDYYSLQPYILEEAYEVVEALQMRDISSLKEELGDLLLQVVFESQIAEERKDFDLAEVINMLCEKLVRRHPHIFGDKDIESVEGVRHMWDEIKKKEKGKKMPSILDDYSKSQPALKQAEEIQKKAEKVGFDWDNMEDVLAKVKEELKEAEELITAQGDKNKIEKEIGDLLFAVVNLARFNSTDPEIALISTIIKFRNRFKYIEKEVQKQGNKIEDMQLKELDLYWEKAKREENI